MGRPMPRETAPGPVIDLIKGKSRGPYCPSQRWRHSVPTSQYRACLLAWDLGAGSTTRSPASKKCYGKPKQVDLSYPSGKIHWAPAF